MVALAGGTNYSRIEMVALKAGGANYSTELMVALAWGAK